MSDSNYTTEATHDPAWEARYLRIGFIVMFVRSVQVSIENWRRGYSILERPEAFDAAPV